MDDLLMEVRRTPHAAYLDDLLMKVRRTPPIPRGQTVERRALSGEHRSRRASYRAGAFRASAREALFQAGTFPSSCVHQKIDGIVRLFFSMFW
jgi:hypothetical protein